MEMSGPVRLSDDWPLSEGSNATRSEKSEKDDQRSTAAHGLRARTLRLLHCFRSLARRFSIRIRPSHHFRRSDLFGEHRKLLENRAAEGCAFTQVGRFECHP